jgi:hypothetical protein
MGRDGPECLTGSPARVPGAVRARRRLSPLRNKKPLNYFSFPFTFYLTNASLALIMGTRLKDNERRKDNE